MREYIYNNTNLMLYETLPPCLEACPLGQKVMEYTSLLAAKKIKEALLVIREDNPLPSICGYVCHHPCESVCVRGSWDDPVSIRDLKLFATLAAQLPANATDFPIKDGTTIAQLIDALNIWSAHDVGKAINPRNIEGQIEGGIQMGLGFALSEEIILENGRTMNPSFTDYKMLTSADMPKIHPIIVEVPEPLGPFGARGVGEATTIPTAGAVANAVFDATGIRLKTLPLSPEKLLMARNKMQS